MKPINVVTYKIVAQDARGVLDLSTYVDGTYVGQSKGYPKKSLVEIYPSRIVVFTKANLRNTRRFDELSWA